MKDRICIFIASAGHIGMLPAMPGTYASAATTLAYYMVYRIHFRILPELHLSIICIITAVGILTSAHASQVLGREDPHEVVIDEVAGQLVALLMLPITSFYLIAATVLFRLFDIWKPFPIRRLEKLKYGVGIMSDDLLAGVYANAVLQLISHFAQT